MSQLAAGAAFLNLIRQDEPMTSFKAQVQLKMEGSAFDSLSLEAASTLLLSPNVAFVDAREGEQYLREHIPKAISFPVGSDMDSQTEQQLRRAEKVVVYCASKSCGASEIVAQELKVRGINNILILKDGWRGWQRRGLAVEVGSP